MAAGSDDARIRPIDKDGFVIITAASDQGMVDIHDRRPLLLTLEYANEWLEPDLSPERAAEVANGVLQAAGRFRMVRSGQRSRERQESGRATAAPRPSQHHPLSGTDLFIAWHRDHP